MPFATVPKTPHVFLATLALLIASMVFLTGCPAPEKNPSIPNASTASLGKDVVIYFSKLRGNEVVSEGVVRKMPKDYTHSQLHFALEALLEGPNVEESKQGYHSEIPKGTRLLGITEEGNNVRINLSRQFVSGGGATSVQQRMNELQQTIFSSDKDHQIYIEIEGEELKTLAGEGLIIPEPLERSIQ